VVCKGTRLSNESEGAGAGLNAASLWQGIPQRPLHASRVTGETSAIDQRIDLDSEVNGIASWSRVPASQSGWFAHGNGARSLEGAQGWHELEAHRRSIRTRQKHDLGALPSIPSVKYPDFMDLVGGRRTWTRCFEISGLDIDLLFVEIRESPEHPFCDLGPSLSGIGFWARHADWSKPATIPAQTDRNKLKLYGAEVRGPDMSCEMSSGHPYGERPVNLPAAVNSATGDINRDTDQDVDHLRMKFTDPRPQNRSI